MTELKFACDWRFVGAVFCRRTCSVSRYFITNHCFIYAAVRPIAKPRKRRFTLFRRSSAAYLIRRLSELPVVPAAGIS